MVGASVEMLRGLSGLEVCGEWLHNWDVCKGFLLSVVYLEAHMGSEVGVGSYKLGTALGTGSPERSV